MSTVSGGDMEPSEDNCGSNAMEPILTTARSAWSGGERKPSSRRNRSKKKPHRSSGKVRNEGPNLRPAMRYQRGTVDVDLMNASYLRAQWWDSLDNHGRVQTSWACGRSTTMALDLSRLDHVVRAGM